MTINQYDCLCVHCLERLSLNAVSGGMLNPTQGDVRRTTKSVDFRGRG